MEADKDKQRYEIELDQFRKMGGKLKHEVAKEKAEWKSSTSIFSTHGLNLEEASFN